MDNWGDPWADNADDSKPPPKSEVTSALPPTFAPAPALLNGFLDDAGWGNDEDGFGEWATWTGKDVEAAAPAGHGVSESSMGKENTRLAHDAADWTGATQTAARDDEEVPSETSDSSSTIQADDAADNIATEPPVHVPPDDDASTRASTTLSEASHNDVPVESPRTSSEDERGPGKATIAEEAQGHAISSGETSNVEALAQGTRLSSNGNEQDDQVTDDTSSKNAVQDPTETADTVIKRPSHGLDVSGVSVDHLPGSAVLADTGSADVRAFAVDQSLLVQLFPPPKELTELDEAPDDPVYSTSGRKAWHRLTRKQTLREFNSGNDADNYIRVTWANSHIRKEVNKVVGRWAREDRISGTGPGARASFYWDTPAPTDAKAPMHIRQNSYVATLNAIAPKQDTLRPSSTNTPAAFNWSSPPVSADPWQQSSPGLHSASSPMPPLHPATNKMQRPESPAVPLDLATHKPEQPNPGRMVAAADENPASGTLTLPPISSAPANSSELWTGLDSLDTTNTTTQKHDSVPVDDEADDDWGEMVSSPTVSTPNRTEPVSQPTTRNNTLSTSSSTPLSAKASPLQVQSVDAMHASPIVRLRSTISPTSALFKANTFVPLSIEPEPIGPGLLRPANRSASLTTKKVVDAQSPVVTVKAATPVVPTEVAQVDKTDEFSSKESAVPVPALIKSRTSKISIATIPPLSEPPTSSTPVKASTQAAMDSWAEADFSLFESAPLATAPSPPKHDPSDSFAVFATPPRTTSAGSSAKSFTGLPPHSLASPPPQLLTGAVNAAQRRKSEEDQIIAEVLSGLPDLGYMLK